MDLSKYQMEGCFKAYKDQSWLKWQNKETVNQLLPKKISPLKNEKDAKFIQVGKKTLTVWTQFEEGDDSKCLFAKLDGIE